MKTYRAHVEVSQSHPTPAELEQLHQDLAQYDAVVGVSPQGWVEVRLSLLANSAVQAARTATALVSGSIWWAEVLALEVMTEEHLEARREPSARHALPVVTRQREVATPAPEPRLPAQAVATLAFPRSPRSGRAQRLAEHRAE